VIAWFATFIDDIRVQCESWQSARGGWRAARDDARQLLEHRRVQVDTSATLAGQSRVVLRTRLRLTGDTETDILRGWLDTATPDQIQAATQAHFASVAAAMSGFTAALGLERLVTRLLVLIGTIGSAIAAVLTLLQADMTTWLHILFAHWWLLSGAALAPLGVLARWLLRWRLRVIFRRGLATGQAGA
jgi:hypothetical protein